MKLGLRYDQYFQIQKKNFYEEILALGVFNRENTENISISVSKIIADIETAGDEKLLEYTNPSIDDRAEVSVSLCYSKRKRLKRPIVR